MSDNTYKVVLLGSSGVGKTSIFVRVKDGLFHPDTTITYQDQTVKRFNVNEKEVKIHLWDTAGMERYSSLTDSYFRGVKAVLFVYSVDNINSFHDLSSTWNKHVIRYETTLRQRRGTINSSCQRFLLANKIDNEDTIKTDVLEALCDQIGINEVFHMSAKTGEGVDDAFQKIAEMIKTSDSVSLSVSDVPLNLNGTLQKKEKTCGC